MKKPVYVFTTPSKLRPEVVAGVSERLGRLLDAEVLVVEAGHRLAKLDEDGWGARRGGFIKAGAMPDVRLEVL